MQGGDGWYNIVNSNIDDKLSNCQYSEFFGEKSGKRDGGDGGMTLMKPPALQGHTCTGVLVSDFRNIQ